MGIGGRTIAVAFLLLFCFCFNFGTANDSITSSHFIQDPEALVSAGNIFKLGFFTPDNSTNRYVGIWYNNVPVITPVWVANRNNPLLDSSGVVRISEDGKLVVLNGREEILWSSNVSVGVHNSSSAQLTDDGNLVLQDNNGNKKWESYQHPSNIFFENMRFTANERTGEKIVLTSWKSPADPSPGRYWVGLDPSNIPQLFTWNDRRPHWRSGPWNGQVFIGIQNMYSAYLGGFNLALDGNGTFSLTYAVADQSYLTNFVLSSVGKFSKQFWNNENWQEERGFPETECDFYGKCGEFGSCNGKNSPICSCLPGFESKNIDEWNRQNWTSGCVRRAMLKCERVQNGSQVGEEDGFLKLETMKVPDFAKWTQAASTEQDCKDECLNNCSCVAYSYYNNFFCMTWSGRSLIDVQEFSSAGADLFIRLAYSEFDEKRNTKMIISLTVIFGAIAIVICVFFSWRWIAKHKEGSKGRGNFGERKKNEILLSQWKDGNPLRDDTNEVEFQELPAFNLQKLAAATDNFAISNKLGQGGFGPVYKGKLPDGQEIAVKRLSRASGQGQEELMNEVVVISRLQHRNLVRLLGCCIEGEEKLLVYEHLPNKSLDTFLFDPLKRDVLDWKKRFNIIEGISRGLLYLHRDSRLRIIHRDLKASNILLDQELNPKISDFGMARIFGGNEDQANTRRVVGTYGYMSPEYAMEGLFSEKSDVFSFGVLLLEIISGRSNTSFYADESALSLLGFVWKMWNEENVATLVDPMIPYSQFEMEILRCIHVGLLCVQEFAKDRPSMSTIISMLNSEILDLPTAKQPAFTERQTVLHMESLQQRQNMSCSINNVTVTILKAR